MTYRFMSSTARTIHQSRSLWATQTKSALFHSHLPEGLLAIKQAQLSVVSALPANRSYLHTSTSIWSENRNESEQPIAQLPQLMNNPPHIVWPSFFKSVSNLMSSFLIIKPYFDNDFSLKEFVRGTKQALLVIANALAVGDLDGLKELLDKEAFSEIKENIRRFDSKQLAELAVPNPEDVYLTFPYQVGIIMNDNAKGVQERFVEITVCFHILRGLSELIKTGDFQPGPSSFQTHRDKIVICNYRFIREFTKGVEGQWTVNLVHHFNLSNDS
ncbi:hypothetical protein OUZ56_022876 [Daphnia magna]|uniref:Tim44-like domain-containing protein n=1 Tax=Daphnia magna TaxID=35525 RepID=A0ABR0AXR2_9CRUS|nr:hypothetical protein OUZ56_022876 [Daphnia magna]